MEDISEKRKLDSGDDEQQEAGGKKQATEVNVAPIAPITVNMSCPHSKVASLIGKKGAVITEIKRRSQCSTIQIDQTVPDGQPRPVQLIGTPQQLSIAMMLITQVLEAPDGQTHILVQALTGGLSNDGAPRTIHPDYYIPCDKVGTVIGPRGQNINEIMRRSSCNIQIIQEGQPPGVDRLVTFEGTDAQIAAAKELIDQVVREGSLELMSGAGGLGGGSEEDLDPKHARLVIGQKGANIALIQKNSGANILINQKVAPGQPYRITYTGTSIQIAAAKAMVATVCNFGLDALTQSLSGGLGGVSSAEVSNQVMQEMNVFQSQMVQLMGAHGANISEVQARCGVKVNIDTTPVMPAAGMNIGPSGFPEHTNKVTVIGSSEAVQLAVQMLYAHIGIAIAAPPAAVAPVYMPPIAAPVYQPAPMYQQQQQQPMYAQQYGAPQQQQPVYQQQQQHSPYGAPQAVPVITAPQQQQQMPPAQQQQAPVASSSSSSGSQLALGSDGTCGHLESLTQQPDGNAQQIAELKNNAIGRLQGKNSVNITLIRQKSGAAVTVLKADNTKGTTQVVLSGPSAMVQLAAQMVQEVLVNGPAKLNQMMDVPSEANGNAPPAATAAGLPQQSYGQPMQQAPMMSAPTMGGAYGQPPQQQMGAYGQQAMYGQQPQHMAMYGQPMPYGQPQQQMYAPQQHMMPPQVLPQQQQVHPFGAAPAQQQQRTGGFTAGRSGGGVGVCFNFQKGNCDKGNMCRFSHGK